MPRIAAARARRATALSEADAGSDVASMTTRAVARRRRLDHQRHEVLDHQRRHQRPLHRVRPHLRRPAQAASPRSSSRPTGASQVDKLEHKLGIKGSPTGVIRFDEVRVPDAHRLGDVGAGFSVAMHTLDRSRPTIGAQAVGIAQGALDYAVGYMKERTHVRPAARRQPGPAVDGSPTARCGSRPRAALVYRACAIVDDGDPTASCRMAGAMAKCFASPTSPCR